MTARPTLVRSIPFWALIAGSLATAGFGTWLTIDTLGAMSAVLADGSATGGDVYVGQVWAIIGGILIGAGLLGLALALVLGVVRSLLPQPAVEIVEPIDWADEDDVVVDAVDAIDEPSTALGYETALGYVEADTTADSAERAGTAETAPAITKAPATAR